MIDPMEVAAIMSALGAALGSLGGILINTKLTNFRIEQLEKKVDKHNNVIERLYKLEQKVIDMEDEQ